ncbi:calponin-3 isoform X1 [Fundulus heteroclitus]|uniref:calponin-3 isoform X1 n=2 Tax=Fundulus heteroclitus TaxID=8078 RepID=UPI00079EFF04|nr:calponin-3 isoform X1 [Fundulus heteroclitus]
MMLLLGVVFALSLTALLFFLRLYFVVKSGSNQLPGARGHVAVLVVAGSGGHTTEIMRLMESLSAAYTPRHYVIADTDKMSEDKIVAFESSEPQSHSNLQFTINRIPRSREVHQSWSSSVVSTLNALRYSLPLLFRLRPDMIAQKYDLQKEEELRFWIEDVTGMVIGDNFQKGLKDGVILCELINKLQPGSVKKINHSQLNWHKLENLGNFIKAILAYGLKPSDIFEANDLFENGNMTQVQTTLLALASMAKTKGLDTKVDIGVKYADRQARRFDEEKIKAGQCVIGLQMGTNKCASQAGMTAYGTRRHLYDPKTGTDKPYDQTTISLQMGTNKGASQAGMSAPGTRRDIFDQKVALQPHDNSTISLQMGTNKVASQRGMSVYGLGRQVYDPKYCAPPTEPVIHKNGSQSTGTNGSEISDSDYQVEIQEEEYHADYLDEYNSHYDDPNIDY